MSLAGTYMIDVKTLSYFPQTLAFKPPKRILVGLFEASIARGIHPTSHSGPILPRIKFLRLQLPLSRHRNSHLILALEASLLEV